MRDNVNIILRFRRFVAALLVLLFSAYYAQITLFTHHHVVDGVTIVHSHINFGSHADDPASESSHTKGELTLIKVLSNFVVEAQCLITVVAAVVALVAVSCTIYNKHILFDEIFHADLRGPPAVLSIG